MSYFVYILECQKDKLYTGIATDVERRFEEHQNGTGAKFTKVFKPIRVLYTEETLSRSDALKREYQIKQLSREEKEQLIARD
jgi:putative endonuclease